MRKTILIFAALIIALLIMLKLSKYVYVSGDTSIELVIAISAVVFFFIGIYLNKNHLPRNHSDDYPVNKQKMEASDLSEREYEVLYGIASGLSNKEIGEKLFLSESTIKTHVSNLFIKLNAKRRTQAIQRAKEMQLI